MRIYSGFVGKHAIPVPNTIVGEVLPFGLQADWGLRAGHLQNYAPTKECFVSNTSVDRQIVRNALSHPNKLAYINNQSLDTFAGIVSIQDAGWLTRDYGLDPRHCEPYQAFAAAGGFYADYPEACRRVIGQLVDAMRHVVPNAKIIACEAHDMTSLTATSDVPPHSELRDRLDANGIRKVWTNNAVDVAVSIYRKDESPAVTRAWIANAYGTYFYVSPHYSPDKLAETLSLIKSKGYPSGVVIWANPESPSHAQELAAVASEAVRAIPTSPAP